MLEVYLIVFDAPSEKKLSGYHYKKLKNLVNGNGYWPQKSVIVVYGRKLAVEIANQLKKWRCEVRVYKIAEEVYI